MVILWDEPKRLSNLDKHGLDFADLTVEFFEGSVVVPGRDKRKIAVGHLANVVLVVVFATLGSDAISVISMRKAGRKERNLVDG